MAIGGPRLDRPSGVGEEGRPRSTSQTIAAVVAVAVCVAVLGVLGAMQALSFVGLAIALFVPGMALLTRESIGEQVVGNLLYHAGAVLVVVALYLVGRGPLGVVVSGLFVALFGVAATWSNVLERDRLEEATRSAATSYVSILGWVVAIVAASALAVAGWNVVQTVLRASEPTTSLFGVLAVIVVTGLLVRGAAWALPVGALAPRDRRESLVQMSTWAGQVGSVVAALAFFAIVVAGALGQTRIEAFATNTPAVGSSLAVLTSPPVVVPLAVLAAVCGVGTAFGYGARKLAGQLDAGDYDVIASVLAGFVFAVFLVGTVILPLAAISPFLPVLVGFALVIPVVAIVFGLLGVAAIDGGVVPPRAAGPALGACGLLLSGVGTALVGQPAPLTFACVAGAMVVWDCSTFGLGLTVELGHRPDTRRLELYHGVLSVGLGVAVVLVATGLSHLRAVTGGVASAWPAVGLAVLGAVLLAVAARRREG